MIFTIVKLKQMKSYLNYSKTILSRMSFDTRLLIKEYGKLIKLLTIKERVLLHNWLKKQKFAFRLKGHLVSKSIEG